MTIEHTPTPWTYEIAIDGRPSIMGPHGLRLAILTPLDAVSNPDRIHNEGTLIVRAVNAHDALVKALEVVQHELDMIRNPVKPHLTVAALNRIVAVTDAALRLAKGAGK